GTISAAGTTMDLPKPFFVLATQNPIEMEGTYTLPEAQIDRFLFRIDVAYPNEDVLTRILTATTGAEQAVVAQAITPEELLTLQRHTRTVPIAMTLQQAIARFCIATQPKGASADKDVAKFIRFGVSPRGAQSLTLAGKAHALLSGRNHVSVADLRAVLLPVMRHRVQLHFEGRAAHGQGAALLTRLFVQSFGRLRHAPARRAARSPRPLRGAADFGAARCRHGRTAVAAEGGGHGVCRFPPLPG